MRTGKLITVDAWRSGETWIERREREARFEERARRFMLAAGAAFAVALSIVAWCVGAGIL